MRIFATWRVMPGGLALKSSIYVYDANISLGQEDWNRAMSNGGKSARTGRLDAGRTGRDRCDDTSFVSGPRRWVGPGWDVGGTAVEPCPPGLLRYSTATTS